MSKDIAESPAALPNAQKKGKRLMTKVLGLEFRIQGSEFREKISKKV